MLLPDVDYHLATSVPHALETLRRHRGARALAGGQTLLNAMKLRLVAPSALVDISRLDELRYVRVADDGTLLIGAGTTYAELAHSAEVRAHHPVLAEVAAGTVDRQVRNRGTIGGNVCVADPTSNFPPLLVALDARLRVTGVDGVRTVSAERFCTGPLRVAVGWDELMTGIEIPPTPADAWVAYRTLQKAPDSWALARAVAWVRADVERIRDARVVLGCVAPVPTRLPGMEQALIGRPPDADEVRRAADRAGDELDPPSDVHASGVYRAAMARVQAIRAVTAALDGRKS